MLTGPARNCEEAERALERKVQQLEAEKQERVSESQREGEDVKGLRREGERGGNWRG